MHNPRLSMIAALGTNRAIGMNNRLLWEIPEDLERFRAMTRSHANVMGRKTFESILSIRGSPLPQRTNIVVTRNPAWTHPGAIVSTSLLCALAAARSCETDEVFVIGGGDVYAAAITYADRLYLTIVEDAPAADAFFPEYPEFMKVIEDRLGTGTAPRYRFLTLEKA